jgi:hypothetical protein
MISATDQIIALIAAIKPNTIDAIMRTSDSELGLEVLLGQRWRLISLPNWASATASRRCARTMRMHDQYGAAAETSLRSAFVATFRAFGRSLMKSSQPVPDHLRSTVTMLSAAFPDPIHLRGMHYHAILSLLMEHMSHRNIVEVMTFIVDDHPAVILNDIYGTFHMAIPDAVLADVTEAVRPHGYAAWCAEAEEWS